MDAKMGTVWELLGAVQRLMFMKRGALVFVAMALVVSACTSVDPSATTTTLQANPPTPPTTASAPGTSTVDPTAEFCGAEFPLFVAGLEGSDPANISGTPGPGPDSDPVAPGQMVSYWPGEYGTYELRWPPTEPLPEDFAWTEQVAGKPAVVVGAGSTRVTLYVQLDSAGDRCSQFAAEMYGPRPDPLRDFIYLLADVLRDRRGAQMYLLTLAKEATLSTAGAEYPDGACADPVVITSELSVGDAVAVAKNFLADRADGRRAQLCLTESALAEFQDAGQTLWPFLCLFECQDGATFSGVKVPPAENGEGVMSVWVTAVVTFGDGSRHRSLRETYKVMSVTSPSGTPVAAITSVGTSPESYVDEASAMAIVADFLRQLAEGRYETAAGLLINEGVSEEVRHRLPGFWETESAVLFEEFCDRAMCEAASEIIGSTPTGELSRDVIVAFDGANGTVTRRIPVDAFEGNLSVRGLPPDGRAGDRATPLAEAVFRGRPHAGLVVLGEHSVEIWGTESGEDPTTFYRAANVADMVAVGEWIAVKTWWDDAYLVPLEPRDSEVYPGFEAIPGYTQGVSSLVGGGTVDGSAYVLVVSRGELRAVDVDTVGSQTLLDSDSDSSILGASVAKGTLAVARLVGETVSYGLYDVRRLSDATLEVSGRRDVSESGARGPMVLAADGKTAAYIAVGRDQLRSTVVTVDTTGAEIGSWQGPEGWNITQLTFDGRWILATLESPSVTRLSRSDRIFVIDTLLDEQWVVNTFARFAFRY